MSSPSPGADASVWLRIPPKPASVAVARIWVKEQCARLASPDLCADAVLLASELVTNGVRHAGTDLTVEFAHLDPGVFLAVSDQSTRPFRPRNRALLDEGGRGLALVEMLSTRWGVSQHSSGKKIWAEIGADPTLTPKCTEGSDRGWP
jgi:anti-sigma regulatory factor (Ser/Thr protein kinase)